MIGARNEDCQRIRRADMEQGPRYRLCALITETQRQKLERLAEQQGCSASAVIRRLIDMTTTNTTNKTPQPQDDEQCE